MPSKKFTVTHPDGSVSKRTSKSREYTYAIVVNPATQEARAAAYNRQADALEAEAAKYEAAAEAGKTRLRDRNLRIRGTENNPNYFHSHEIDLLGTETPYTDRRAHGRTYCAVQQRANYLGEVEAYGSTFGLPVIRMSEPETEDKAKWHTPRPVVDGAAYVIADAKASAEGKREQAAKLREQGAQPDSPGYGVLRWSSRRDLAEKALSEFDYAITGYGRTLSVVPVDQTP